MQINVNIYALQLISRESTMGSLTCAYFGHILELVITVSRFTPSCYLFIFYFLWKDAHFLRLGYQAPTLKTLSSIVLRAAEGALASSDEALVYLNILNTS